MRRAATPRRITRGLRFRLTASYALFFTLMLIGLGVLFRHTLAARLESQVREVLEQEWAAVKGYLRIEKGQPIWFFDSNDPDESYIVERIRRVYLLTDARGELMQGSVVYRSIGIDPPEKIREVIRSQKAVSEVRSTPQGGPYLIRAGVVYDEGHHEPYYLAMGRSLADDRHVIEQFTLIYLALIPLLILVGCVLGWHLAGRALSPVLNVARAAQRISGSNLSLRIPTRRAGDELDYLIETFNRMIERLDRNFQQIRQFSTDVSHELRTPITAIRGQLEVALFTAKTSDQYRDAILNALQDVEQLSRIVRALLLLSQAESGQLVLQKARLDLTPLVRDIVDQFEIPAEAAGVRLSRALPPECFAELDRTQIERMLSNLLSNAIKFTGSGGEVRVEVECGDDQIEIRVEDTGRGISKEHLPHIFNRFYRVPDSESSSPEKGLGLGLSFVAWIAKAHGGVVDVDSELGKGTRFRITLPTGVEQPQSSSEVEVLR